MKITQNSRLLLALAVINLIMLAGWSQAEDIIRDSNGLPLTDCPGSHMREPLRANRIHTIKRKSNGEIQMENTLGDLSVLTEGRNLRLDSDSYPRKAGALAGQPVCVRDGEAYRIGFALDRYDDVVVRAIDEEGAILHNIACGVLGPNAPTPFQKDSLKQEILWDGKNADGQRIEGVHAIEVAVGLQPKLENFVGYDPAQLTPYLRGLTIDKQGRVYVTLHTAHRYDPSILRFDRDGNFLEMVYPSNPDMLAKQGRKFEDEYDLVEYIDGYPAAVKPSNWRAWIEHWDDFVPMPFKIGPDNKGYMIIGMPNGSGTPLSIAAKGDVDRMDVIENLDDFWYFPTTSHVGVYPPMYLQRHDAGFAFDGKGHVYLAAKPHGGSHGPQPYWEYSGTIRKVDLATGKNVAAFTEGPGNSPADPSYLLRVNWSLGVKGKDMKPEDNTYIDEMQKRVIRDGEDVEPDPQYDSPDRFCDIEDLTVDKAGNILVADGYPRRIKCYAENGAWLGQVEGIEIDGRMRRFHDLISIEAVDGSLYLLSSFRDDMDGPVYLVKCEGAAPEYKALWTTPLDPLSRYIAVDTGSNQPIVWVGNGGGPATLSRIVDKGHMVGPVRHIGEIENTRAIDPAVISADADKNLYIYDRAREAVLKYNDEGEQAARLDLNPNVMAHYYARYRRFPFQGKKHSIYQDGTRYFFQKVRAIVPDLERDRVWIQYHATYPTYLGWYGSRSDEKQILKPFPAMEAYDPDLREKQMELWDPNNVEMESQALIQFYSAAPWCIGATTDQGNILSRDGGNRRDSSSDFAGSIKLLKPDMESEILCNLFHGGASLTVDSRGNIYTIDGAGWPEKKDRWGFRFDYIFPTVSMTHWAIRTAKGDEAYSRGEAIKKEEFTFQDGKWHKAREAADHIVRHQSEVAYLVKFGPEGGDRGSDQEKWALRGGFRGQVCPGCDDPLNLLACDGADRIILGDVDHSGVKLVDTAGNLITRFGRFGNAQTVPGADGNAKEIGFRNIYCVAASGENAWVSDRDMRRVARVKMEYREKKQAKPE